MGQKINPVGFRLGFTVSWMSRWFTQRNYHKFIHEDKEIRKYVKKRLDGAGISKVEVERASSRVKINIYTARPGIVIGKKGKEIDDIRRDLFNLIKQDVVLNIIEVRKPDVDAQLIADNIKAQIERRVNYKRALKEAVAKALRMGAEGAKVRVGGRVGGVDIARAEVYREGRLPLHTLRAEVDYGVAEAMTTYGIIGIKVWIFKGEIYAPGDEIPLDAIQL